MYKRLRFLILLFIVIPTITDATTLYEALDKAAGYFTGTSVNIQQSQNMVISVVNYHSQSKDQTAKQIETDLYFALEKRFPKFKLILESEALAGVSSKNAVFIKGTYEQKGETTVLRFQAVKGLLSGEILAQTEVEYETVKTRRKTLVAVLDIEANALNEEQRRIFSDVFRTALGKTGSFDMASSSDVDKMNPDDVQKATGCTRDTCATIIGEQLGVDRVISSSIRRIAQDDFYVSAKIMDIQDGSILTTKTIRHQGSILNIGQSLETLAMELTGEKPSTGKNAQSRKTGVGQIVVSTMPSKAIIVLDGRRLMQKTDTMLKDIPAGTHKIYIYKDNLGVEKMINLQADEIRRLSLKLAPIPIKLLVVSEPFNADLRVDGRYVGKTPFNLKTAAGEHQIEIEMKGYEPYRKIVNLKPAGRNRLDTRLVKLSQVKIESNPSSAKVYIDHELKGTTPLSIKMSRRTYQLKITKSGYKGYSESLSITSRALNHVKAELVPFVTLSLSVSPPDAEVEVQGQIYRGDQMVDYSTIHDFREITISLPAGSYRIRGTHPEAEKNADIRLKLDGRTKIHHKKISLDLKSDYLDRLRIEDEESKKIARYESSLSSYRMKWICSFVGGMAMTGYAFQQNSQASATKEDYNAELDKMNSAPSNAEAQSYYQTASEYYDQIEGHNQMTQASSLLAVGLFGLAAWIWLDEPEKPEHVSWTPSIETNGQISFNLSKRF